jgi:hypothetical protein
LALDRKSLDIGGGEFERQLHPDYCWVTITDDDYLATVDPTFPSGNGANFVDSFSDHPWDNFLVSL